MADLDYALLADYARVDADGHAGRPSAPTEPSSPVPQLPAPAGCWPPRDGCGWAAASPRRGSSSRPRTPGGRRGAPSRPGRSSPAWSRGEAQGRVSACFAVAVVAPLSSTGPHALVLSVNDVVVAELPFGVVVEV
ncbi:MAG: hypothetical protein PGN11_09645 [Quadrisphaera sp.]